MLLYDLALQGQGRGGRNDALAYNDLSLSYGELERLVRAAACGLKAMGARRADRVAVYAAQRLETVIAMFGASAAGCVVVPVNPVLKTAQLAHIIKDSGATILITDEGRYQAVRAGPGVDGVRTVVIGAAGGPGDHVAWPNLLDEADGSFQPDPAITGGDLAALLYTSGSTGLPKGVMASHANLVLGAQSVVEYLHLTAHDRILCALPLSFDYGLSQLTSALAAGGTACLINHLFPADIVSAVQRMGITGLACVPPLWNKLARLSWPDEAQKSLRYITNSGGHLPQETVDRLVAALPETALYLMYGLTEAFRSTYLEPALLAEKPGAMGCAIPNAHIAVVDKNGEECGVGEHGELVHAGPLVTQGYWRDPERTAVRYKPPPPCLAGYGEIAVWSGDIAYRDEDGVYFFVGRDDGMIKSSGYRISPQEIENVLHDDPGIVSACVIGIPDADLGQRIIGVVEAAGSDPDIEALRAMCKKDLPAFMVPAEIVVVDHLPRNPNGKIDRSAVLAKLSATPAEGGA